MAQKFHRRSFIVGIVVGIVGVVVLCVVASGQRGGLRADTYGGDYEDMEDMYEDMGWDNGGVDGGDSGGQDGNWGDYMDDMNAAGYPVEDDMEMAQIGNGIQNWQNNTNQAVQQATFTNPNCGPLNEAVVKAQKKVEKAQKVRDEACDFFSVYIYDTYILSAYNTFVPFMPTINSECPIREAELDTAKAVLNNAVKAASDAACA